MHPDIDSKLPRLRELCREHRVARMWLFGSAASDAFDPERSDVDLLVEFEEMEPVPYKRAYFALWDELRGLFGRDVDLVTARAVTNKYIRRSIQESRVEVFGA